MADIRIEDNLVTRDKPRASLVTSAKTYSTLLDIPEDKIVETNVTKLLDELNVLKENITTFKEIMNTVDPYVYFNKGTPNVVKFEEAGEYKRVKRNTLDCIFTTISNSVKENMKVNGNIDVSKTEDDIYWQIAEMEAIGNFNWMKCFFTVIIDVVFQQLAGIIYSLANGVENFLTLKIPILFIGICINIGVILKAILIMFVHYPLLYLIYFFEDIEALNYITYTNKKTGESRKENIYRKKIGSIADKNFYPYFHNKSYPVNAKNKIYLTAMQKTEAVLSKFYFYLLNITFGSPKCNTVELNLNLQDPEAPTRITTFMDAQSTPLSELVDKCSECTNCFTMTPDGSYTGLMFNSATSDLVQTLNNNIVDNPNNSMEINSIYSDCRLTLNDLSDHMDKTISTVENYNMVSDNFIPESARNDITKFMLQVEKGLQFMDNLLEMIKNGDYVDLAKLIGDEVDNNQSAVKTNVSKRVLDQDLVVLNNKYTFLIDRIREIEEELRISKQFHEQALAEYHSRPSHKNKQNIKQYEKKVGGYEKSLELYNKELTLVVNDIATVNDKLSNSPPPVALKVSNENAIKKATTTLAIIVFIMDMICCVLSILMLFSFKQFETDDEAFKKVNDNFAYKLFTGQDISGTSVYTAIEWSAEIIDAIGNAIITILNSGMTTKSDATAKFAVDFNIVKILTSMIMNVTFTTFDYFLKQINDSIFQALSESKAESRYEEVLKVEDAEPLFKAIPTEDIISKLFLTREDIEAIAPKEDGYIILLFDKKASKTDPDKSGNSFKITTKNGPTEEYRYVKVLKYNEVDVNTAFDEFIEFIASERCLSINFIFDLLLSYIRNFHLRLGLMAEILAYEPKFDISVGFELETLGKTSSFKMFLDILKLILKNLDFFVKFCRMQDDVDTRAKLRELILSEAEVKQDTELYEKRYESYITSTHGGTLVFDPSLYEKNIETHSMLLMDVQGKIDRGELTDEQLSLLKDIYKEYQNTDLYKSLQKENVGDDLKKDDK